MSRIGTKPIEIESGIEVKIESGVFWVKGPKGELKFSINDRIKVAVNDNKIEVSPKAKENSSKSFWGLTRSLINNAVEGVSKGFSQTLVLEGVGYKAQVQGKKLVLNLGYSHPIEYQIPEGVSIKCTKPTELVVESIDKQLLGSVTAKIKKFRKIEPYKGKGVKFLDEYVRRKEGKKK